MKILSLVCSVQAVLCVGNAARAQIGPDMMGLMRSTMISPGTLLVQMEFRNELKLKGEQGKKIDQILKDYMKELESIQKEGGNPSSTNFGAMMGRMTENETKTTAAIKAELLPEQWTRFRQIQLQILGYKAYYEADVMEALALSPEQVSKLDAHKAAEMQRFQDLMIKNQGSGLAKAMKKQKAEAAGEISAILTEAQRLKFKEILGAECKAATKRAETIY